MEFAAVVAIIATMVAALAVWLPRQGIDERPPPVIPAVALKLHGDGIRHVGIPPIRELVRVAERHDPFDAIARWADRERRWYRALLVNRVAIEVVRGARDELRDEIAAAFEDPLGYGKDLLTPPTGDDVRDLLSGVTEIPGYLRELRDMNGRDAVLRLSHDAGRLATRVGLIWLRRRASRAVLRRIRRSPPPETSAGRDPQTARPAAPTDPTTTRSTR